MTSQQRPVRLVVAAILVAAEAVLVGALTVVLLLETLTASAGDLPGSIALTVVGAIGTVFVAAIAVGLWRRQAWTRAAGIVWQLLQAAVGIGALQGIFAQPWIGWPLIGVAVIVLLLISSRKVGAALGVEERGLQQPKG